MVIEGTRQIEAQTFDVADQHLRSRDQDPRSGGVCGRADRVRYVILSTSTSARRAPQPYAGRRIAHPPAMRGAPDLPVADSGHRLVQRVAHQRLRPGAGAPRLQFVLAPFPGTAYGGGLHAHGCTVSAGTTTTDAVTLTERDRLAAIAAAIDGTDGRLAEHPRRRGFRHRESCCDQRVPLGRQFARAARSVFVPCRATVDKRTCPTHVDRQV